MGPDRAQRWPFTDPRISGAASADSAAVASATGTAERTAAAAKAALQRLEDRFLLKPKLQLFELPIFSSEIRAAMALVAFVGGLVCFRFDCVILRIHAYSIKEHCTHVFASLLTI